MDDQKLKEIKYKVGKIASSMKKIEDAAHSEIKNHDDYLQVCGAMLAVCRNMAPKVGAKKFPGTSVGFQQAQKTAKATGQQMTMRKGGKVKKRS